MGQPTGTLQQQAIMVMWASATYDGKSVCVQNTMTNASKDQFSSSMANAFPGITITSTPMNSAPFSDDNFTGLTPCNQNNLDNMDNLMDMGFDGDGSSMWN